jgi:hypothetical protein
MAGKNSGLFQKEYSFRGGHAEHVQALTSKFGSRNSQLFNRNLDVYMIAPLVGFCYQRRGNPDLTPNGETTKIFPEQLIKESQTLWFIYRLILLLDKKHERDFETRVHKAFRNYGKPEAEEDEMLFDSYVLGGVELLYEKLLENGHSEEDYINNLYDFLSDFSERYYSTLSADDIQETVIKLAKTGRTTSRNSRV